MSNLLIPNFPQLPLSHMDVFASSSIIIIIIAFTNLPITLCHLSKEFKTCSQTFNCANISDISYPFYGFDRPEYCGHPGFELLNCNESGHPKIRMMSQEFDVIRINSTSSTIDVARDDYNSRSGCPSTLDKITIDSSIFQYTPSDVDITLLYDNCASECSSNSQLKAMVFPCPMNDTYNLPVCYLTKKMMSESNISCPNHLLLPVHMSDNEAIDRFRAVIQVSQAVWKGFELKWSANNGFCEECVQSGGQCGHDWRSNKFFCFCTDESKCPFPACFSAIGIGMLIILAFYFMRRKLSNNKAFEVSQQRKKKDVEAFLRNYGPLGSKRYTYTDLKKITNSFKDKLGEGGYGAVYRGKLHNGHLVAVKILKKPKGDAEDFINEVASIGKTNHVNIVTLLGFCYEGQKRALVYDFMPNGSLEKFIYGDNKTNHQSLSWEKLFQIAVGIARGLEYLHRGCNTRILHFDIKPHNILLDENFCPKISDFGLAKSIPQKESIISMSEARGTVGYIAPEVLLKSFGGVSYKSDVYSYGMLVLEMVGCRRKAAFEAKHSKEQYFPQWIYEQLEIEEERDDKKEGILSSEEEEIQRKMIMVSLWCVQTNPASRPAMTKVVEMLEGTLESLKIPPKSSLASSLRSQPACSTTPTTSLGTSTETLIT